MENLKTQLPKEIKEKAIQDSQYMFPYHYIPILDNGALKQFRNLGWGFEYLSYINFVIKEIKKTGFDSLLDVGCGDGRLIYELNNQYTRKNILGLDYSQKAIALAKSMNPSGDYICGDITKEGLLKSNFDIITAIETLEHIQIEDLKEFIGKISENIRPGGKLIVTVPSINVKLNRKHFQHFSLESFERFVPDSLRIEKHQYINVIETDIRYRIIKKILTNDYFVLNNSLLLRKIYQYYTKKLFFCEKNNCRRIYLELIKTS